MKNLKYVLYSILILICAYLFFNPRTVTKVQTNKQEVTVIKHDTIVKDEIKIRYITPKQIEDQTINNLRTQIFRDSIGNQATLTSIVNGKQDSTLSCKLNIIDRYKTITIRDSVYKYINIETLKYIKEEQKPQILVGGSVGYSPFNNRMVIESNVGLLNKTNIIPNIGLIYSDNLYLKIGIQIKLK